MYPKVKNSKHYVMLKSGLRHQWVSCGFDFYEKTPKSFGQRLGHFRFEKERT